MKTKKILSDWDFSIDKLNYKSKITAPHTWNVCEETQHYRGRAEYQTTVFINEKYKGKQVILKFGAVYHTASILVNGKNIGIHSGSGYTPFSFDITNAVVLGEDNKINVIVDNKPSKNMLPYAKCFDWADDGGLIREVSLLFLNQSDIENVFISPLLTYIENGFCDGYLDLNFEFYDLHKNDVAKLVITEYKTNRAVLTFDNVKIQNNCASIHFKHLKVWDFDNPNLYNLTVTINDNTFTQRFGLRKIRVSENYIFLNNKPVYLTGCEWMPGSHPDYGMAEPIEHSIKCLKQLKDSGCRFTRFHWQQDSRIYDWCDENGLLVQEEIPYWGNPGKVTPKQFKIAKMQADEMIKAHFNHPSIVFWGVGNELGGFYKATQKYVKNMVAYFKSKDKTRLVNYVSNTLGSLKHWQTDATLFGDIAMWNEYLGLWMPCVNIPEKILAVNKLWENKPLVITEFGLCEPFFKGGDERRTQILVDHIAAYNHANKIQGYVWFSLNDYRTHIGEEGKGKFRQRVHGSTDLSGNIKPSYNTLCEINKKQIEIHK